jgi:hypothetical protein
MPSLFIQVTERLAATTAEIDLRLNGIFRLPTAVTWNRLEGRPRSDDLTRPLRAEVRDPAWMLARQWQLGEFEGQDAGAPIVSKVLVTGTALEKEPLGVPPSIPFDPNTPIEVLAESQAVEPDLIMGLYIGRRWLRVLANQFGAAAGTISESFMDAFGVKALEDKSLAALELKANLSEYFLRKALIKRSLDGSALIATLRQAKVDGVAPSAAFGARGVVIAAVDTAAVNARAHELLTWFESKFGAPPEEISLWTPSRLEYDFSMRVADSTDKQTKLVADQFTGGRLDWYSFDALKEAAPEGAHLTTNVDSLSFVPTPVTFSGMPNVRWWEFEDRRVGFGITTASKTDLVKMLLAEFGLVFSNDWFIVPLGLDTGSLFEVNGIVVTDNFGLNTLVEPLAKRHREMNLAGKWTMWTLSSRNNPGQVDPRLFLVPAVNRSIDSAPLDEVLFLRDEMANLVWAVETVIPDQMGGGRDARFAGSLVSKAVRKEFEVEPENEVADVPIFYRLMGTVPENWIPLVAVKAEGAATATLLLQGALPRLPVIEPARDNNDKPILENNVVLPRGTILSRDPVNTPNVIHEEEILRDGIRVRRRFRQTRWLDGRPFTWCSLEKQSGRGEGSSGLAFDQVRPKPPKKVS